MKEEKEQINWLAILVAIGKPLPVAFVLGNVFLILFRGEVGNIFLILFILTVIIYISAVLYLIHTFTK